MTENVLSKAPQIDHLLEAPILYFDHITYVGIRGDVVGAVISVNVEDRAASGQPTDRVVAVANLRFTRAAAAQLRDRLEKILVAGAVTPGRVN